MPVDAAELSRLYTVPPEEFVAARNAAVKELRAAKDRESAAVVAKLRRPSVADWALNTVAVEQPDALAAVLEAASQMRQAQEAAVEGREGPDVRSAVRDLREHSRRVLTLAEEAIAGLGRPIGPQVASLTARLAEVAANEAAAEQLRAGHLGSADVDAIDPFAGLTPAARRPRQPRRQQAAPRHRPSERPSRPAAPAAAPDDAVQRRRLERAAAAARKDQGRARSALVRAEERVVAADKAAAAARSALDKAGERLAAAQEDQRRAAEAAVQADARLEDAEAALGSS